MIDDEDGVEWFDPSPFIKDGQKLIEVIGEWPSFDDAELIRLTLDRTDGSPHLPVSNSPTLTMTVRLAETGYYLTEVHFDNVADLDLSNFRHQNVLMRSSLAERFPTNGTRMASLGRPDYWSRS